jgi:EmrB/QacA subfamily drug resistance transporter
VTEAAIVDQKLREPARLAHVPRRKLAAVVLVVASLMDMIDVTVVNVALPTIHVRLHAGAGELEWVVSAYMLAFAAFLIPAGSFGDLYGRRRVFMLGVAVFGLASLSAGIAQSPAQLIGARLVQGAAAAAMTPQVLATFRSIFFDKERGVVFGIYGAVLGVAAGLGLVLGGALTEANLFDWHWRTIFFVNVPVAAMSLLAAYLLVPETRAERPRRPDIPGALFLALGLAAIAYALLEGRSRDWPLWIFSLLGAGVFVVCVLGVVEAHRTARHVAPMLRPRLLAVPAFSIGLTVQFAFSAALQSFSVVFTLWLQLGQHFSPLRAGLTMLAFSVGSFLVAPFAVELAHRWGRLVLALGGLLLAGGTIGVDVGAHHLRGGDLWPVTPGLVIAGAGLALLVIPLVNVVLAAVPRGAAAGASGLFSTAQQLGGALGVATIGSIFFSSAGSHSLRPAFLHTVPYIAGVYALAGLLAVALPSHGISEAEALEAQAAEG